MGLEQEFRTKVKEYLYCLNSEMLPVLRKLIQYNYPKEVVSLEFEIFVDGFTQEFPVRAFFMDADNSEHFIYIDGKAEYPSPVDPGLLDIEQVYPSELEEEYTAKDDHLDPWCLATDELVDWFSKCWCEAGGESFRLRANISPHDSNREFNLVESKWQKKS